MLQLEDKLKSDYVTDKSKKKYLDKHKSWLEEDQDFFSLCRRLESTFLCETSYSNSDQE